jgi:hypothetical protein
MAESKKHFFDIFELLSAVKKPLNVESEGKTRLKIQISVLLDCE